VRCAPGGNDRTIRRYLIQNVFFYQQLHPLPVSGLFKDTAGFSELNVHLAGKMPDFFPRRSKKEG
jgi:hypothetical protein